MSVIDSVAGAGPFDYGSEAELYSARPTQRRRQQLGYRRFSRAADAIRFAMEELPDSLLIGTYLEVGDTRFEHKQIRGLYDSAHYPLPRREAARSDTPDTKEKA